MHLHNTLVAVIANLLTDEVSVLNVTADTLAPALPKVECDKQLK